MTSQAEDPVDGANATDGQLVTAAVEEQDPMAFELLLRRYQRPLFGFIRRQVGGRAEAEDLFQQTVLRIFDRLATCQNPEAFRAWAFGIAANVCRYEGRTQLARGTVASGSLEQQPGWAPSPEAAAQDGQLRERISAALAALQPRVREVFVLYHYTQLSYDEVAEVVGAPVGTVKSRMNTALTQLRTLLVSFREVES